MVGRATVKITRSRLYVRFSKVSKLIFDELVQNFYRNVPSASWNKKTKWMEVSATDIQKVLDFSYGLFGLGFVQIEFENGNTKPPFHQLALL